MIVHRKKSVALTWPHIQLILVLRPAFTSRFTVETIKLHSEITSSICPESYTAAVVVPEVVTTSDYNLSLAPQS